MEEAGAEDCSATQVGAVSSFNSSMDEKSDVVYSNRFRRFLTTLNMKYYPVAII